MVLGLLAEDAPPHLVSLSLLKQKEHRFIKGMLECVDIIHSGIRGPCYSSVLMLSIFGQCSGANWGHCMTSQSNPLPRSYIPAYVCAHDLDLAQMPG